MACSLEKFTSFRYFAEQERSLEKKKFSGLQIQHLLDSFSKGFFALQETLLVALKKPAERASRCLESPLAVKDQTIMLNYSEFMTI